ncbi:reticulocalbin-2 isoform X1 [Ostrinia furnacalis]|uniref:reticulocalbin-2 isoform X1 n=1 Tax=Ostrinia furnacalis TaxID=93504 RepID=UPI00103C07D3|nr:reticulocalbin-2 isoform X1 [Ostrinia furnacalis]
MASEYFFSFLILLSHNVLLHCASAAVHSHSLDNNIERESDGSYRSRDFDHYNDAGHNSEFDHEAILGSVKEAEEYDKLTPEESRRRLALLLPKMDLNGDQNIDRLELKKWILNSFINLSREEAEERMSEVDDNRDGVVSWPEYLQDAFGVDTEEEVGPEDTGDSGMVGLLREEKEMFKAADINGDGVLDIVEFEVFTNPEEHAAMHPYLVNQTMREKDKNNDGRVDFNEYIGERGSSEDKAWLVSERDKFDHELDTDGDGVLSLREVEKWVIPDNEEIAEEEVDHLFASADDDHDDLLSFAEILAHHDVFVGSEATDYGGDLLGEHFDDEL